MGRFQIPNQTYIRADDQHYFKTFQSIQNAINQISDQANVDPTGAQVATPPSISGINVVEQGGIHDIQITDQSPAYAGIRYKADYSQTADFQNYHSIDMGSSQNHRANLGSGQYFWRASSYYHPATPSSPAYHGGVTPAVVGSGSYSGPPMQQNQSFTGQYRSSSTPPIRK